MTLFSINTIIWYNKYDIGNVYKKWCVKLSVPECCHRALLLKVVIPAL